MGIVRRTEAEKKLESAKKHIESAIEDLSRITVGGCDGYRLYTPGARRTQWILLRNLVKMREAFD